MTQEPLTPRQVQLLKVIAGQQSRDGYSPTIGELAQTLSISRTTVFEHIEQLRRKGLLSHLSGRTRSLTLTSKARKLLRHLSGHLSGTADTIPDGIPLAGVVAAGSPIEAVENRDNISIHSFFGSTDDVFALEVRGDSMVGDDIRSGDYIICRRSPTATDGQLAVAIVDNKNATLKRFYRQGVRARLQPANNDYEPIYSSNCRIEGVVIGLIRKL
jgi:repressor LexA